MMQNFLILQGHRGVTMFSRAACNYVNITSYTLADEVSVPFGYKSIGSIRGDAEFGQTIRQLSPPNPGHAPPGGQIVRVAAMTFWT